MLQNEIISESRFSILAGGAEAAVTAVRPVERRQLLQLCHTDLLEDELGDAVAPGDIEGRIAEVEEENHHVAAVICRPAEREVNNIRPAARKSPQIVEDMQPISLINMLRHILPWKLVTFARYETRKYRPDSERTFIDYSSANVNTVLSRQTRSRSDASITAIRYLDLDIGLQGEEKKSE